MISHPTEPGVGVNGPSRPPPIVRPVAPKPRWRRRRWQLAGLGAALVVILVVAVLSIQPPAATGPTSVVTAAPALIAHGKIMPARQARVGTLSGGVLRQLYVSPGAQVADQAALAVVEGPAGLESITAPFAGVVTNVLVHEGDTLVAGSTLVIVADPRTLQAETTDVDEFLVTYVSVGQPLTVTVDTLDNLPLQGIVKSVAGLPQPDATGAQNYPVIISLNNVPPQVIAGMSIRVTFPDRPR